jgi:polyisoprenyl-phosphate glycosyltransferase
MRIEIVIPIFNEEENLQQLFELVNSEFNKLSYSFLINFIDDSSTDSSWEKISNLSKKHDEVKGVQLSRNFGHQAAIDAGVSNFTSDALIIMDGDLQDDPKYIPSLIKEWEQGSKIVLAKRIKRYDGTIRKFLFNIYFNLQSITSDIRIPKYVGHFSLLDKAAVDELNNFPEKIKFFNGLRAYLGFPTSYVEVIKNKRYKGKTKMSYSKLFNLGVDGIFGFTTKPLTFIGVVGILISSASLLLPLVSFFNKNLNLNFESGILILFFLSGIQLLALSLLGKYIGTIFIEIKRRPNFIIKEKTD